MNHNIIIDLAKERRFRRDAAKILMDTFLDKGMTAWPDMDSALKEVDECVEEPNICLGLVTDSALAGWVGLRPMYETTWELHPLVVSSKHHRKGFGRILMDWIEQQAKDRGIIGIVLGTDDEMNRTSLSKKEIRESNIFKEIEKIENIDNHPYEFYRKCGYMIVGLIPNANGINKPDIWMWKNLLEG